MEIKETLNNEETGHFIIGKNDDDIIKIYGYLKAREERATFHVIVTHNGITPKKDYIMNPEISHLTGLFQEPEFTDHDIILPYNVGNIGGQVKIQATVTNIKL